MAYNRKCHAASSDVGTLNKISATDQSLKVLKAVMIDALSEIAGEEESCPASTAGYHSRFGELRTDGPPDLGLTTILLEVVPRTGWIRVAD